MACALKADNNGRWNLHLQEQFTQTQNLYLLLVVKLQALVVPTFGYYKTKTGADKCDTAKVQ